MSEQTMVASADEEQAPDVVYHYTTVDTLLKIVSSKALWATSVKYLNDASEYKFFVEEMIQELPNFFRRHPEFQGYDPSVVHGVKENFRKLPFITSFTNQRDSLPHWRSYCPSGNGVCIGFKTNCLAAARARNPKPALPGTLVLYATYNSVSYLETNNKATINHLLDTFYEDAREGMKQEPVMVASGLKLLDFFAQRVGAFSCFCKEYSFRGELEYRLVLNGIQYRQDLIEYRTVRSSVVPYVALQIPTTSGDYEDKMPWDAIESVTVGPTPNMGLTKDALQAFFEGRMMSVTMEESKIPYRDW
jgi:hypothetical protein